MKKLSRKSKDGFIWTSYSDLSTGMMMSFVLMLMYALHEFKAKDTENKANKEKIAHVDSSLDSAGKISKEYKKITEHMANLPVDCSGVRFEIPTTNSIAIRVTFISNKAWFESGDFLLNESGKKCLRKFGPLFLSRSYLLDKNLKKKISQLTVEGHTNSDPYKNGKDVYLDNLDLSQKRALETVKFIIENSSNLDSELGNEFKDWRLKVLAANGRSFADLIPNEDGTEDKEASKRVEFKASLNYGF
jgi:flagellar motor protein MotB